MSINGRPVKQNILHIYNEIVVSSSKKESVASEMENSEIHHYTLSTKAGQCL